jgi:hypothetical protein
LAAEINAQRIRSGVGNPVGDQIGLAHHGRKGLAERIQALEAIVQIGHLVAGMGHRK